MKKTDPDSTMMISQSMILPLPVAPGTPAADSTMLITAEMMLEAESHANDATMMLTSDMIVKDKSRGPLERALAVVGLWHVALKTSDRTTLLATTAADIELRGPRGNVSGSAAFVTWIDHAAFKAVARRRFAGGEGTVVVEQLARWRESHGDVTAAIASAFVVRDGRIRQIEWFDELAMALTIYKLGDANEVPR